MFFLKPNKRTRGVTLVEVLVVSSMLASLSGGSYQGVKDKAKQEVCASNLKQLGLAIFMFAEDNDGRLPVAWFYPWKDPNKDKYSIKVLLWPYVKNQSLFLCPSAPEEINKRGLSYVWNDTINALLIDQIQNPSQTWLMADMNGVCPTAALLVAQDPKMTKQRKAMLAVPPAHLEGYNILYADGHVKWSKEPPQIKPVIPPQTPRSKTK